MSSTADTASSHVVPSRCGDLRRADRLRGHRRRSSPTTSAGGTRAPSARSRAEQRSDGSAKPARPRSWRPSKQLFNKWRRFVTACDTTDPAQPDGDVATEAALAPGLVLTARRGASRPPGGPRIAPRRWRSMRPDNRWQNAGDTVAVIVTGTMTVTSDSGPPQRVPLVERIALRPLNDDHLRRSLDWRSWSLWLAGGRRRGRGMTRTALKILALLVGSMRVHPVCPGGRGARPRHQRSLAARHGEHPRQSAGPVSTGLCRQSVRGALDTARRRGQDRIVLRCDRGLECRRRGFVPVRAGDLRRLRQADPARWRRAADPVRPDRRRLCRGALPVFARGGQQPDPGAGGLQLRQPRTGVPGRVGRLRPRGAGHRGQLHRPG